jgi:hypothetical protein
LNYTQARLKVKPNLRKTLKNRAVRLFCEQNNRT